MKSKTYTCIKIYIFLKKIYQVKKLLGDILNTRYENSWYTCTLSVVTNFIVIVNLYGQQMFVLFSKFDSWQHKYDLISDYWQTLFSIIIYHRNRSETVGYKQSVTLINIHEFLSYFVFCLYVWTSKYSIVYFYAHARWIHCFHHDHKTLRAIGPSAFNIKSRVLDLFPRQSLDG